MRVGCIIQARTGSTRLPGKINADIGGQPMLWHVKQRMNTLGLEVLHVATPEDYPECEENDVLQRYLLASERLALDIILRVTGDCPLVDPIACLDVLMVLKSGHFDYVANDWRQFTSYPDGMGCEAFHKWVLEDACEHAQTLHDREHVTPWIQRQCDSKGTGYNGRHVSCPTRLRSKVKFSVDTEEDLERVRAIDKILGGRRDYSLAATLEAYSRVPSDKS